MKKVIVGLVMTAVLSNVVLAAEFESMSVTGNESVQSVDMNNDMLFMNVDGEVMTLEEMEAIEGEGLVGGLLLGFWWMLGGGAVGYGLSNGENFFSGLGSGVGTTAGFLLGFYLLPF